MPELKLEHIPEELFLHVPKATWIWSSDLGPGVIAIKPCKVTWHLDRDCRIGIQRKGFAVASDFSGTAHSFAGDNLKAAFIDCLPWDVKPDKAAQLSAYMTISRVSSMDDILIMQPFSPVLFAQGNLPGPELLLKFQRKILDTADLEEQWKKRREQKQNAKREMARQYATSLSWLF